MKAVVLGGTGFVGAHVARKLVERGDDVLVVSRRPQTVPDRVGPGVEGVPADLGDPRALAAVVRGADVVFNVAGHVGSTQEARRVNSEFPGVAVEAAAEAGVARVIHTSSVVTIGPSEDGQLGEESSRYRGQRLKLSYVESKHRGELEARRAAERTRIELVTTNPAYIIGVPVDRSNPWQSSAGTLMGFASGRYPALVDGPTNVVDVEDVAAGHLLACDEGRPGRRYILGGTNTSWVPILEELMSALGTRIGTLVLPRGLAPALRALDDHGISSGRIGLLIRLAAPSWQYSSERARVELGFTSRPLSETLDEVAGWHAELVDSGRVGSVAGSRSGLAAGPRRAAAVVDRLVPGRFFLGA